MYEPKHTPGPWAVDPNINDSQAVVRPDGFIVADCGIVSLRDGAPTEERRIANAQLIATAPRMLQFFLRFEAEVYSRCGTVPDPEWDDVERALWHEMQTIISAAGVRGDEDDDAAGEAA